MKYRPRKIFGGAHSNNFSAQRTNCRLWRNYSQMLSSARARTGDWAEVRGFDLARNSGWSRNHYWLYRKSEHFSARVDRPLAWYGSYDWLFSSQRDTIGATILREYREFYGQAKLLIGRKWFENRWVKYEIHRPILIFSFPPLRIPAARLSFYLQIVASNRSNQTSKNLFGENASSRSRRKHQRYQIRIKNIYDATITF